MQQNQFKTIFTSIIEQCTLENEVQRLTNPHIQVLKQLLIFQLELSEIC